MSSLRIHQVSSFLEPVDMLHDLAEEMKVADEMKLLICCLDSREIILDLSGGGPIQSHGTLKGEKGGRREPETWQHEDLEAAACALKMQERATCQGKQMVSRSWKKQGNGFSSRASNRNPAPPTSCF